MNLVQQFAARCAEQTRPYLKENVELSAGIVLGTFGVPQLTPMMMREGYKDIVTTTLTVERALMASPPVPRSKAKRVQTGTVYFVQAVDTTSAVNYSLILVNKLEDVVT